MIINNITIGEGDYILGFAKDRISYHYLLAYAMRVNSASENSISVAFNGYHYDDGTLTFYTEDRVLSTDAIIDALTWSYIATFSKERYEKLIEIFITENLDEDNMFAIFDDFWAEAITQFNSIEEDSN